MEIAQAELTVLYEEGAFRYANEWEPYVSLRKWNADSFDRLPDAILEYGYHSDEWNADMQRFEWAHLSRAILVPGMTDTEMIRHAIGVFDQCERDAEQAHDKAEAQQ